MQVRRLTVLVVDGDHAAASEYVDLLNGMDGFDLVGALRSGRAALDVIGRTRPDVVLLDIDLPDIPGLEVLKRLRLRHKGIRVIVCSAAQDRSAVSAAFQLGARHYLVKPIDTADLAARLRAIAAAGETSTEHGLSQRDIDQFFRDQWELGAETRFRQLPKGLSDLTMDLVIDNLKRSSEPLTASELGNLAGIARVSARRYLEYLAGIGAVEVTHRYGSAGRPQRQYRWLRT